MQLKLLIIILLLLYSIPCFAQEQPIDLSKPVPETLNVTDADILEIEGFDLLPEPQRFVGKVIGVHDGDTLTLLDANKVQYKVRFGGIDAPELKQDFGNKSKENLSNLIFGEIATIICPKKDKYNRWVCTVWLDGKDINFEQVKNGFAWHYKKYQDEQSETDRNIYSESEINARSQKLGLWAQPNPTEPSAWRRGENNPNTAGVPKGSIIGNSNSSVYHTPGCSTYAKVSPQNQVIFTTEHEAIAKGYRIAGGCESTLPVETRPKPNQLNTNRIYQTGPRGGCYYLSPSGKKVYVAKSFCN